MREEVGFWLTVALVAVAAVALFKFAGAKVGDRFPGLQAVAAFI